jgi:DNA repair exonuclease SbcCD ATPase subunit
MIPRRVGFKGFLCFRDEHEVCFDGASLWMLAGPNGSGKSTVFDAVTYALFGQHRGGKQNARELVNKQCESLAVEFDFLLDGERYQIRRTLRRKTNKSTRQIYRWSGSNGDGKAGWQALPATNSDSGLNAWVRDHIGLNYETFTSSVLLLQGKAEKLLAADPAERFRVLAGIVDLSRYQRLFERAEARYREFEAATRSHEQQLETVSEVGAADLDNALAAARAAQELRAGAQAEWERLQRIQIQNQRWHALKRTAAELRNECKCLQEVAAAASALENDWRRLNELRFVLPHLDTVFRARLQAAECH